MGEDSHGAPSAAWRRKTEMNKIKVSQRKEVYPRSGEKNT